MEVHVNAAWSAWFKGDAKGHCTLEELAAVLSGKEPLPPDGRVKYGVSGAAAGPVRITISLSGEKGADTAVFDPTAPKSQGAHIFMMGQEHGVFRQSNGWDGIFHVEPLGKSSLALLATDSEGKTASLTIPWIAHD